MTFDMMTDWMPALAIPCATPSYGLLAMDINISRFL